MSIQLSRVSVLSLNDQIVQVPCLFPQAWLIPKSPGQCSHNNGSTPRQSNDLYVATASQLSLIELLIAITKRAKPLPKTPELPLFAAAILRVVKTSQVKSQLRLLLIAQPHTINPSCLPKRKLQCGNCSSMSIRMRFTTLSSLLSMWYVADAYHGYRSHLDENPNPATNRQNTHLPLVEK